MKISASFSPQLPENKVKICLIGERYEDEIKELNDLGIECIKLKNSDLLDNEIACHGDILAFNINNNLLILDEKSAIDKEICNSISQLGYTIHSNQIKSPYPYDVSLNVANTGKHIIGNIKYMNPIIIQQAETDGIEIINTKQGYSKCNLCMLTNNAAITEDAGLAYLLKNYQYDVLLINSGEINLSDKHNGFIGGASAKLSDNLIYFSGNIENHTKFTEISQFLNKYRIKPVYNKKRNLRDFGGIVVLK